MNPTGREVRLINIIHSAEENTPKWSLRRHVVDDDLSIYHTDGGIDSQRAMQIHLPKGIIFFQFNIGGPAKLQFGPLYAQEMESSQSMLLYNPTQDLDFVCSQSKGSRSVFILTTVSVLHGLIVEEADDIHFLNEQNIDRKYYLKNGISPNLKFAIEQIYSMHMGDVAMRLFLSGKAYELLSYYFQRDEQSDYLERCPFLKDQRNVEAVRNSRHILIERMAHPPTIKELSLEVGLNEYQLKAGFKNIYGNSINSYLQEHRINKALKLMTDEGYKVQEAANEIGYTNVSHFIAAFKKKHGVTPKQYMKG
ncbi:MAG: helix-turn-helix transcriptional regulator [Flavobacteriales bacterium]|nr:helix-turn-helix transcriptional regulator [Flavobacteriales bacterium]NNK80879.1 helix-turn-helix transcriptional regulator [Flavobacteriales bacterium]